MRHFLSTFCIFNILTKSKALSSLLSSNGSYYSNDISEFEFIDQYLQLNASEISAIAHQPQDLIKECSIIGPSGTKKCDELRNGTMKIFTPDNGVCYMFNQVDQSKANTAFQIDNVGPRNGLKLTLSTESKLCYLNVLIYPPIQINRLIQLVIL